MIGNDVIDLELAQIESNWQRKGFLNKIFTKKEQDLIRKSENNENTVWNLWSRKEAAYKIWNRKTGIRKYNPIQFECFNYDSNNGKVKFKNYIFFTKTVVTFEFIHTISALNLENLNKIKILENSIKIDKQNGLPYYLNNNQEINPISKSHHGRFEFRISL